MRFPPEPSLVQAEQIQFPQSFIIGEVLEPFDLPHGSSGLTLKAQCLSYVGGPRLGHSTPNGAFMRAVRGDSLLPAQYHTSADCSPRCYWLSRL